MASSGQILSRVFFWSYERGTWQYDAAVALILIFVLVPPRRWFHDQPEQGQSNGGSGTSQVQVLSHDGSREVYRVDAHVLALPEKVPALENQLHNALQRTQAELRNGRFAIAKIEPLRDEQGNVTAYRVEIQH